MEHKEVFLVNWKRQKDHVEIFDDLQVFVQSYPRYNLVQLEEALSFGQSSFENEEVRVQKKAIVAHPKPDFYRGFFWDFDYDKIDWKASYDTVIQRILERGDTEDWKELVRFYGAPAIVRSLKEKVVYLPGNSIDKASEYFKIQKEEMLCYKRRQSQTIPWP